MKTLIVLFVLYAGCANISQYSFVYERYAVVIDGNGASSGVRVGKCRVITAEHCVRPDSLTLVSTPQSKYSAMATIQGEIAILFGDYLFMDSVSVADAVLGEEVFWLQPRFEPNGGVFLTFGRVAAIEDSSFYVDRPIMFGASGSGVWNKNGKLVGILQAIVTLHGLPMYGRATKLIVYDGSVP